MATRETGFDSRRVQSQLTPMQLQKIHGVFHAKFKDATGRTKSVTTRCSEEREARQVVKESGLATLELAAKAGRLTNEVVSRIVTGKKITLEKALDAYLQWMPSAGRAPKSIHNSQHVIGKWMTEMKVAHLPPMAIDESTVSKWINNPKSDTHASTRSTNLGTLRPFFRYLLAKGWITSNPAELVRVSLDHLDHSQKERKEKETFNPFEIKRLIADCESRGDQFWQFAIMIGSETGLRLGDIVKLEWSCFDREGVVTVWTDKRDKRVELPISKRLAELVTEIPVDDPKYLFPDQCARMRDVKHNNLFSMQFKRLCEKLGIEGKSFHCLRHTVATRKYANIDKEKLAKKLAETLSLGQIAQLLGHSDTKTSKGYVH